jgi:hypothetical protein
MIYKSQKFAMNHTGLSMPDENYIWTDITGNAE